MAVQRRPLPTWFVGGALLRNDWLSVVPCLPKQAIQKLATQFIVQLSVAGSVLSAVRIWAPGVSFLCCAASLLARSAEKGSFVLLACLLDMDGVLYRGKQVLPGVPAALTTLEEAGHALLFATNNGWDSPEHIGDRLRGMGVTVDLGRMVTASWMAAELLQERWPTTRRPYVLGSPEVRRQLQLRGMDPVSDAEAAEADALVVGIDLELTYDKLATAQSVALRGVPFIGTDLDGAYPWEDRWLPGSGSFVAAIERASGRKAIGAGKPEPTMYQALLRQAPAQSVPIVVGDNPATDIRAGNAAGYPTVLVLTGIASVESLPHLVDEERPTFVVPDLAAFVNELLPELVVDARGTVRRIARTAARP